MTCESVTSQEVLEAALTASDRLSVTASGELAIEDCEATALLARFGSPLFVLSDRTLRQNVRRIRTAFEAEWPGSLNVMYAIKCNPSFAVRAVVHEEGAGGDCFGMGELEATFAGGADPDTIALNGSSKSDETIARAVELGVAINMDDESEPARNRRQRRRPADHRRVGQARGRPHLAACRRQHQHHAPAGRRHRGHPQPCAGRHPHEGTSRHGSGRRRSALHSVRASQRLPPPRCRPR